MSNVKKSNRKWKRPVKKAYSSVFNRRRMPFIKSLPIAFPNKYVCKVNYSEEFTLDASAVTAVQAFRANSCFDPNLTGIGHQPMGFDQLCALYTRFIVLGSKIRVTAIDTNTAAVLPAYWGVQLTDSGTRLAGVGITTILEQERNSLTKPLVTRNNIGDSYQYKSKMAKYSTKKFFRLPKGSIVDDQFTFTQAADPPTGAYFEVYNASLAGNDPGSLRFLAQIQYILYCYTPLVLTAS